MKNTPTPFNDFKAAGGVETAGRHISALIVDVQLGCICHMASEDAHNYLSSLATQITEMREKRIPVTWATVDKPDNTKFHPPSAAGQQIRSVDELKNMGFYALAPKEDLDNISNKTEFDKFILEHGPRTSEAVFTKPAFNAFGTSEKDRIDAKIPLETMPRINAEHEKFINHMKAINAREIAISGAVGSVCCLETAIGGRQNGLDTSLILDGIVCWRGQGQESQLVWRDGFESADDANLWHRSEVRQATQKPERGFTDAEVAIAKTVRLTTRQDLLDQDDQTSEAHNLAANPGISRLQM